MSTDFHHPVLREIAKFAAGVVLGDILALVWLLSSGLLPLQFIGAEMTTGTAVGGIFFDVLLLLGLAYYGWHSHRRPAKQRAERWFHITVSILLGIIAIVHLARVATGAEVSIAGWEVPIWLNSIGAVLTGLLAYLSFRLNRSK